MVYQKDKGIENEVKELVLIVKYTMNYQRKVLFTFINKVAASGERSGNRQFPSNRLYKEGVNEAIEIGFANCNTKQSSIAVIACTLFKEHYK